MAATTNPLPTDAGRLPPELARQVAALSRETKEQLLIWLQEELDGRPGAGNLPESPEDPEVVKKAWRDELAKRIRDIQEGGVALTDARESVAKMRQRIREKFGV